MLDSEGIGRIGLSKQVLDPMRPALLLEGC